MRIETNVQEKIFKKHGVMREEIEEEILEGRPRVFKTKDERYKAITHKNQYLTVIFEWDGKETANIITAYKSTNNQIKLYKRK